MSISPQHLLEQAQALAAAPSQGAPRQVNLRRAVSATYYAFFHSLLAAMADQFIGGPKTTIPYRLIYRSIAHKDIFNLCKEVVKTAPEKKLQPYFPSGGFGPELKQFAGAFMLSQQRRHIADYDPAIRFARSDVISEIAQGQNAFTLFNQVPDDQRLLFLSLIAFPPRS